VTENYKKNVLHNVLIELGWVAAQVCDGVLRKALEPVISVSVKPVKRVTVHTCRTCKMPCKGIRCMDCYVSHRKAKKYKRKRSQRDVITETSKRLQRSFVCSVCGVPMGHRRQPDGTWKFASEIITDPWDHKPWCDLFASRGLTGFLAEPLPAKPKGHYPDLDEYEYRRIRP
jgi:hypothetical protein